MAFTIDKSRQSPNRSGKLIAYKYLMLHHTASDNFAATVRYLCQPSAKASANYVVGKAGEIAELVPPGTAAWHAGNGSGFGVASMNRNSIGIEIVNWGDNKDPFPEVQLQALDWLIAHIDKTMGKTVPIIDHKAWAPGRKIDMRANFPLVAYQLNRAHAAPATDPRAQWAYPGRVLKLRAFRMRGADVRKYQTMMDLLGWAIDVDGVYGPQSAGVCKAFQRAEKLTVDGQAGPKTWARMVEALYR